MKRPLLFVVIGFVLGEAIACFTNIIMVMILVIVIGIAFLTKVKKVIPISVCDYKWLLISYIFMWAGILSGLLGKYTDNFVGYIDNNIECNIECEVKAIEDSSNGKILTIGTSKIYGDNYVTYKNYKVRVAGIDDDSIKIGNILTMRGRLMKFEQPTNYGEFNAEAYYKSRGYDFNFKVYECSVINSGYNVYGEALRQIRDRMIGIYRELLPEKEGNIIIAMLLGDKSNLDKDVKRLYQQVGISHIIAISGLHLAIIGGSLFKLLRKIGFSWFVAGIIAITLIVSYGALTGLGQATVRAIIMLIISIIGQIIGRTYDMLTSISIAAIIMLFFNVHKLLDAGFLLSYGAVIAISVVYPILKKCLEDIFLIRKEDKESDINKSKKNYKIIKKNGIVYKILDGLLLSLSVQLVSTPIILYFYYETSLYGIILNIFVIPLMSILMPMAILGGVIGLVYLPLGKVVIGISYYILKIYEISAHWVSNIIGNRIVTGNIRFVYILMYYIVLAVLLYFIYKMKFNRKIAYGIMLAGLLIIVFLIIIPSKLQVIMLDVGQGDCIYMKTPNGSNILIDGGSSSSSSVGEYIIKPTLKYFGVSTIDYIFISHGDSDHISGICYLLENQKNTGIQVKNIVLPNIEGQNGNSENIYLDDNYIKLINLASDNNTSIIYMGKGDKLTDGDVLIECLHPSNNYSCSDRNDYSMVLNVEYGEFNMLFTGDLSIEGEEEILSNIQTCEVLKVAHHGSNTSTCDKLLDILEPDVSLISCSERNNYGHPGEELLNRLENHNSNIYITKDVGAIKITASKEKYLIETYVK